MSFKRYAGLSALLLGLTGCAHPYRSGDYQYSITKYSVDLNGDGRPDIIELRQDNYAGDVSGNLKVRLHKLIEYGKPKTLVYFLIYDKFSVTFDDVDNDGDIDIVIRDKKKEGDKILEFQSILINDGRGNFQIK